MIQPMDDNMTHQIMGLQTQRRLEEKLASHALNQVLANGIEEGSRRQQKNLKNNDYMQYSLSGKQRQLITLIGYNYV